MDKKGAMLSKSWIVGLIILLAIVISLVAFTYYADEILNLKVDSNSIVWLDSKQPDINWDGPIGWALKYTFGINSEKAQSISAMVVLIAVWIIFFLTFADGIDQFGFFSQKEIAWVIGLALAVILANMGFYYNLLINFMGIFSFLAGLSVIFSLASIFVVMFGVHWGIGSLAPMIMMRKAMHEAAKAKAGGEELAGTIRGLKKVGKALAERE